MGYDLTALRRMAMVDESKDEDRHWVYTDNCQMCGGVKAFLDWIEEQEESFESLDLVEELEMWKPTEGRE